MAYRIEGEEEVETEAKRQRGTFPGRRERERQKQRHRWKETHRQTHTHIDTHTHTDIKTQRHKDTQMDRQQPDMQTGRWTDRVISRERRKEPETQEPETEDLGSVSTDPGASPREKLSL